MYYVEILSGTRKLYPEMFVIWAPTKYNEFPVMNCTDIYFLIFG